MNSWNSYVAIGDSFSEGLADPDPSTPDRFVGWTDRLAHWLAVDAARRGSRFQYANLAVRGRLMLDIVSDQLPLAIAQHPDLISIVGGGNDLLRPSGNPDNLAEQLEDAVEQAQRAGSDVLLVTGVDPGDSPVFSLMRGRDGIWAAHVNSIAQRTGAHLVDVWGYRVLRDTRLWAEDRLHLTPGGHYRVAYLAAAALGVEVDDPAPAPLPTHDAVPAREQLAATGRWAADYLRPWIGRRLRGTSSGDGIQAKRALLSDLDPSLTPPAPEI